MLFLSPRVGFTLILLVSGDVSKGLKGTMKAKFPSTTEMSARLVSDTVD